MEENVIQMSIPVLLAIYGVLAMILIFMTWALTLKDVILEKITKRELIRTYLILNLILLYLLTCGIVGLTYNPLNLTT